eukprot:6222547-Heterocapsa_arctica.AAC.1
MPGPRTDDRVLGTRAAEALSAASSDRADPGTAGVQGKGKHLASVLGRGKNTNIKNWWRNARVAWERRFA